MRKTLIALLLAVALTVIPVGSALAASTQDVTITATPTFISITNDSATGNNYNFGVVAESGTPGTGETYFTITNDSTVDIDIDIQCDGWEGGSDDWAYASPIGADQGYLDASDGAGGYDILVQDGTDTELFDTVATTTDPQWGLELNAPSSFTFGNTQQTTVTLTASAAD
jgi:hypothetical protein